MSMIDAQPLNAPLPSAAPAEPAAAPRPTRSNYLWEGAKTVVAVATFAAMLLPLAFPSKAGTQARLAQVPAAQMSVTETQPVVAAKPPAQPAKATPAAPVRNSAVPQPAKKPAPKNT